MRIVASASKTSRPETARHVFFKADHLRPVDRYIDYFAERPVAVVPPEAGGCGGSVR